MRFYKDLSNGNVVVVEKELDNSDSDMETITIWGELSDVIYAKKTQNSTSETPTIGRSDIAKIIKDAETKIENDEKKGNILFGVVAHTTLINFQLIRLGTGEGAEAYGYGLYFTDKESIAKEYAKKLRKKTLAISEEEINNIFAKDGEVKRLLKEGKLVYINKATLPSEAVPSTQGNQFAIQYGDTLSGDKVSDTFSKKEETVKFLDKIIKMDKAGKNNEKWRLTPQAIQLKVPKLIR